MNSVDQRNTRATGVQHPCNAPTGLSRIVSPRTLRDWAFLSQSQMAGVLEIFGYKCSRFTVAHYEGGRRVPSLARKAYAAALAWKVELETDGLFTTKLTHGWLVSVRCKCECGRFFQPERRNMKRCKRCRKK